MINIKEKTSNSMLHINSIGDTVEYVTLDEWEREKESIENYIKSINNLVTAQTVLEELSKLGVL